MICHVGTGNIKCASVEMQALGQGLCRVLDGRLHVVVGPRSLIPWEANVSLRVVGVY